MHKVQRTLLLAVLSAAGGVGLFLGVSWLTWESVFFHDFRGRPLAGAIRLSGPQVGRFVKTEAEGLRITLPKDRQNLAQVGFAIDRQVRGDFEVTATFEIVQVEEPRAGYGAGVILGVDDRARVGRLVRPQGEQLILWDFWPVVDGVRKMEGNALPCIATSGRMRLKRTGAILHFQWSPGTSGEDFEEIHQIDYGAEDTKFFTCVAESSGQKCAVDIRVVDFQIRSVSANAPIYQWVAAGVAAIGVAGGGLLGWRTLKPKRAQPRPETQGSVVAAERPAAVAPTENVARQCPNCQKRLKVPAGVVGKKVKCPGCASAFVA